jgi:hypothetical protein
MRTWYRITEFLDDLLVLKRLVPLDIIYRFFCSCLDLLLCQPFISTEIALLMASPRDLWVRGG